MIKEEDFSVKQRDLYETMSDISEDCYCAVWMIGLEFALWSALQDGNRRYGMGEIDAQQLEKCRELAKDLDGWIVWVDDDTEPGLPTRALRFVSMSEWLPKVTAKRNSSPQVAHLNCRTPFISGDPTSAIGDSLS